MIKQPCKIKEAWIRMESGEHHKSRKEGKKIVRQHIKELGCGYYPELIKMENKLKRRNKL
jgi:hypothetical protein